MVVCKDYAFGDYAFLDQGTGLIRGYSLKDPSDQLVDHWGPMHVYGNPFGLNF